MKIIFISYIKSPTFTRPADWIKRLQGYTGILESLSRQHTVISIEQINYEGNYMHQGVEYQFINFSRNKLYFPRRLHLLIKKLNPDIVFVHGLHFPLQVIQLRMTVGKKVKILIQNHAEKPFTGLRKYVQRLADRSVDAYFFASRTMGEDWVRMGNLASGKKIYEIMEASSVFYPLDPVIARAQSRMHGDPVYIWVGRLDENKDPLLVVRQFLRFAEQRPGAHLYIIHQSTGLLGEIQDILRASKPEAPVIHLIGKIPHDEMIVWLSSADFIISSSHYEGGGIAVCEGMSCGCIPILTDIPSFRMMTDNGGCGLLYPAGDEQGLLDALIRSTCLDVAEYRARTLAQFRNRLSFEAIADGINQVIDSR